MKTITKAIEKWDKEYEKDNKVYLETLNNNDDINKILIFLNKWGCRIPKIEFSKIDRELQKKLIGNKYIVKLKKLSIEDINLDKYKKEIKDIFEEIKSINKIGGTAVSKILHLKLPKLFIMWDIPISQHYGYYQNGEGYFKFLKEMKKDLAKDRIVQEEAKKKRTTIPKIIDEYNYIITRKSYDLYRIDNKYK
ncbi:MAG: hypothetical protein FVQ77_02485 [Cytophagales bacterium]|nr:hypothetical protein [Cytophagales bacterium]